MTSGGNNTSGCREMYDASVRAKTEVMALPWQALEMARRVKRLLKTEVGRPRQVRRVKGLKRYVAATVSGDQAREERGDV